MKPCLTCLAFILSALVASLSQNQENAVKPHQVTLKYLGAAGWKIANGTTTILVNPYLSRINGPAPPGEGSDHAVAGDTRRAYAWTDIATPDIPAIDAHIQRAYFVLVTHTHYDHILDVPHIALKTRATVIGAESTENVMRAYDVPEDQLITVQAGEDYRFQGFSLRVFPSIHSPLDSLLLSIVDESRSDQGAGALSRKGCDQTGRERCSSEFRKLINSR